MSLSDQQLKELAASSETWLRGKIADAEVDKCVDLVVGANKLATGSSDNQVDGVTGTVICVIFYWRATLTTPDNHQYVGNAGGIGSIGGGGIQGGVLVGLPDLPTLYSSATSFQFTSAAIGLNINFFDGNSNLVGTFVGGGLGICLGTGGGSGSWSPSS